MSDLQYRVIEAVIYVAFALCAAFIAKSAVLIAKKRCKDNFEKFAKTERLIWRICMIVCVLAAALNVFRLR